MTRVCLPPDVWGPFLAMAQNIQILSIVTLTETYTSSSKYAIAFPIARSYGTKQKLPPPPHTHYFEIRKLIQQRFYQYGNL